MAGGLGTGGDSGRWPGLLYEAYLPAGTDDVTGRDGLQEEINA